MNEKMALLLVGTKEKVGGRGKNALYGGQPLGNKEGLGAFALVNII